MLMLGSEVKVNISCYVNLARFSAHLLDCCQVVSQKLMDGQLSDRLAEGPAHSCMVPEQEEDRWETQDPQEKADCRSWTVFEGLNERDVIMVA